MGKEIAVQDYEEATRDSSFGLASTIACHLIVIVRLLVRLCQCELLEVRGRG